MAWQTIGNYQDQSQGSFQGSSGGQSSWQSISSDNPWDPKKRKKPQVQPQPTQTQPPQNFFQKAVGAVEDVGKGIVKQVADFLPHAPEYAENAITHPLTTAEGAGIELMKFGGAIGAGIETGFQAATGLQVPDRFNFSKQLEAFNQLVDRENKAQPVTQQHAFDTGRFLGQFIPYTLGEGVAEVGVAKAAEFMPALSKFVPAISEAAGFVGVGQIEFDPKDPNGSQTRADQLKNDLISLALFKAGGKLAGFISKPLSESVSKGLSTLKTAVGRNDGVLNLNTGEEFVSRFNGRIEDQTGQSATGIVGNEFKKGDQSVLAEKPTDAKTPYDTPEIIAKRQEIASLDKTSDINTPEREQLRQQIADSLYGNGAKNKSFRADIVTGPPAAGKSTVFVDPLKEKYGSLVVDSDEAKKMLPEFNGGTGSDLVHDESSGIAENVMGKAVQNGDNIVLPLVGKNLEKMQSLVDQLHQAGYDVHLHHNTIPIEEAAKRAVQRFKDNGRFIDPDYILNKVGSKPDQVYDIIKAEVDSYEKYSNDVPQGEQPQLLESSRSRRGSDGRSTESSIQSSKETPSVSKDSQTVTPVGEGEKKTSTLSKKVEAKAIENDLTSGFGNLPEYSTADFGYQSEQIGKLINDDWEKAVNIALGKENPPNGILPPLVFAEVEKTATRNGDLATIQRLAQESTISTTASYAGQYIRALGERDPMSPVALISDIQKDRAAEVLKKTKQKSVPQAIANEVSNLKSELKKVVPNQKAWKSFIDTIEC